LVLLLALGLGLRGYYYFSDPPVWHDEAALIANVLHKDFGDMLGPLYYAEACPPLFLALEKAVTDALGDGTLALRLVPFVAGCVAVFGLLALGQRVLPRRGVLWLALLVGTSPALLWHCSEAKPYSVDLLVATGVVGFGARCRSSQHASSRLLLWLAGLSPVLMFLSFPAAFVLGGVALTLLPGAWRGRESRWLYGVFVAVLATSFLVLFATTIRAQKVDLIEDCWAAKFPPWDEPWLVPAVLVQRFTGIFRYAAEPSGNVLCPLAVVGGIWLWRAGQRRLVGFLVWPLAFNTVAWLLSSYPMDASRVVVYATPAALLLTCAGIGPIWEWLKVRAAWALIALALLLMAPAGLATWSLIKPWTRRDSRAPVAFVLAHRAAAEPVIGTCWEQQYYCRKLGPDFRWLVPAATSPPTPPATAVLDVTGKPTGANASSLWLLSHGDAVEQAAQVRLLQQAAPWCVAERYVFRDIAVFHLRK
jgi:hypothetical protein